MGAIIVKEDQIIATGYDIRSGTQYELCRSVHAEQNAIINAARSGVSLLGGDIYIYGELRESKNVINAFPCFICKKMIINTGLNRVITSTADSNAFMIFSIKDWVDEWQKKDIIEDKIKYGQ